MKRIEEIIVVEGRDDTAAVNRSVDAVTIETHGYGIRKETWEMLQKAYDTKGLIVFTDPDPAGERIRRRIIEKFPKAKEAFLDQQDATKDGDIGIENADPEEIERALLAARGSTEGSGSGENSSGVCRDEFTSADMDRWRLAGCSDASERRRKLGRELGIGFAGAKTFLKRLNHFGISRKEIETLIEDLEK